jgi:hypothetical protein
MSQRNLSPTLDYSFILERGRQANSGSGAKMRSTIFTDATERSTLRNRALVIREHTPAQGARPVIFIAACSLRRMPKCTISYYRSSHPKRKASLGFGY